MSRINFTKVQKLSALFLFKFLHDYDSPKMNLSSRNIKLYKDLNLNELEKIVLQLMNR